MSRQEICWVLRKNCLYFFASLRAEGPAMLIIAGVFSVISFVFGLGISVYLMFLKTLAAVYLVAIFAQILSLDYGGDSAIRYTLPVTTGDYIAGSYLSGLVMTAVVLPPYTLAVWGMWKLLSGIFPQSGILSPWGVVSFPAGTLLSLSVLLPLYLLEKWGRLPVSANLRNTIGTIIATGATAALTSATERVAFSLTDPGLWTWVLIGLGCYLGSFLFCWLTAKRLSL